MELALYLVSIAFITSSETSVEQLQLQGKKFWQASDYHKMVQCFMICSHAVHPTVYRLHESPTFVYSYAYIAIPMIAIIVSASSNMSYTISNHEVSFSK